MNFVIGVHDKSGLFITSGVSMHLQKLMYFPQVGLAPEQAACLIQCFSLLVFYSDLFWLVPQHPRFPFPFTSAVAPLFFYFLGFEYIFYICSSISFLLIREYQHFIRYMLKFPLCTDKYAELYMEIKKAWFAWVIFHSWGDPCFFRNPSRLKLIFSKIK